jgi:hypothetical protein
MIDIKYNHPNIRVETKEVSKLFNLPLKLSIVAHVSKKEVWSCELNDNCWASFSNDSIFDIVIKDTQGKLILNREWDIIIDGSYLDKALYLYCKSNPNSKGLAIGTHDGEFGEWVTPVINGITKATLVEASLPQFKKLNSNYSQYNNVTLIHNLVTTEGQPIEFFEGGKGYTNSVKQEVINSWEKEPISSSIRSSISINDLLKNRIDWLHTDIEGYDAELLQAINPNLLPPFIIFEHNNLKMEDKLNLENYLIDLGYYLNKENSVSYLAIKI